jgi:hypothetical protein
MSVDVGFVSRTMAAWLERDGRRVVYRDRATGDEIIASPAAAVAPDGLLPALLVAGEAVWREATGRGFALDLVHDRHALLGYRLRGIDGGHFASVMLATIEAASQVAGPEVILASELGALWRLAGDPARRLQPGIHPGAGAAP